MVAKPARFSLACQLINGLSTSQTCSEYRESDASHRAVTSISAATLENKGILWRSQLGENGVVTRHWLSESI